MSAHDALVVVQKGGHEVCVVDVKKGRVARRIPTRRDPDAVVVVSVSD